MFYNHLDGLRIDYHYYIQGLLHNIDWHTKLYEAVELSLNIDYSRSV